MPNPTGIKQHTDRNKYVSTPAEQKLKSNMGWNI
jgi:hypothetical protein